MIATAPLIDSTTLDGLDLWQVPYTATRWRDRLADRMRITEIGGLTLFALLLYVISAYWIRYDLHFWINDALNRTDDAIYVTVGRDPHLAAIGFYWPPLPQLIQLPLVPVLKMWNQTIMAGPLSSAICMALTIPVLARIGQRLGVGRVTTFCICVAFAVNPVVIYYAGIGMSEACSVLFGAIAMLGFLSWIESDSTLDLLILTLGLCGSVLTRLEEPFVTIALALVASLTPKDIRRSAWNVALIGIPPVVTFSLWLLVQWIIEKDALFFRHQSGAAPPSAGTATWLPKHITELSVAIEWAAHWVLGLGPILVLPALLLFVPRFRSRIRGSLGILAAMGVFAALQIDQVITGTGFGNPRYFMSTTLYAAVAALWIATRPQRAPMVESKPRHRLLGGYRATVWNGSLVALLLLGGVIGSRELTNAVTTHVESECSFFEYGPAKILPFLGGSQTGARGCARPSDGLAGWRNADRWIDAHLTSRDRVLADNSVDYAAELFTPRTRLFVVRNDTDWGKTIANPSFVTYIMTQSSSAHGRPNGGDAGALLISLDTAGWKLVASFGQTDTQHSTTFAQVWHFVPPSRGAKPIGTESGVI